MMQVSARQKPQVLLAFGLWSETWLSELFWLMACRLVRSVRVDDAIHRDLRPISNLIMYGVLLS
jgi:hypothetical protein